MELSKEQLQYLKSLDSKKKKRKFLLDCLIENVCVKETQIKESTLEVGKWYKFKSGTLGFFQGIGIKSYGFHFDGNEWINDNFWFSDANLKIDNISLATPQEVETALSQEFEKQSGIKFDYYVFNETKNILFGCNENKKATELFNNGQWAKIIDSPIEKPKYSPEEIELVKHNINQREVTEQGSELLKFDMLEDTHENIYRFNLVSFNEDIMKSIALKQDPTNLLNQYLLTVQKYYYSRTNEKIDLIIELFPQLK